MNKSNSLKSKTISATEVNLQGSKTPEQKKHKGPVFFVVIGVIALIVAVFGGIGIMGGVFVTLATLIFGNGGGDGSFVGLIDWQTFLGSWPLAIASIATIVAAFNIYELFSALRADIDNPFTGNNIKYLNRLNFSMLLILLSNISWAILSNDSTFLDFSTIFPILFIEAMILVFKRGKQLQDEKDLTV
jgi:hypothetical protein